jgi:two-component system sensor histidine kinase/response regulator
LSRRLDPGLVNATLSKPVTASDLFDTLMRLYGDPAKVGRVMPELSATPGAEKLRGATVLLVEDNLLNQRLAAEMLKGLGISVDIANDGAEGLAAVQKKPYDAVLMDMQMPVMDGVEATQRIRDRKEFEHLPIIAITANVLPRDTDACLDAGMNDFIPKPINPAQMIRVLGRWIGTPPGVESPRVAEPKPASAPPAVAESGAPINVTAGLARLDGNHKLFGELLEIFRGHHKNDRDKFQAAMAAKDRKKAHHLIHTLKGVAGNLAMPRLWAASAAMQQAVESGEDVPDKLRRDFDAAFDGAFAAVDAAIAEVNAGAKPARPVKSGT